MPFKSLWMRKSHLYLALPKGTFKTEVVLLHPHAFNTAIIGSFRVCFPIWAALTKCLHCVACRQQKWVSYSLGDQEIQDHSLVRICFLLHWQLSFLSSVSWLGEWALSGFTCTRALTMYEGSTSSPNHFPKAMPPNTITLEMRFQHEFGVGASHSN